MFYESSQIDEIGDNRSIQDSDEEVGIFLENCSSLYNLILDSLHNLTSKTISCEFLEEMETTLKKSANKILAERPEAENSVILRLNTICCAMEQLRVQHHSKIMSGTESDTSSSARSTASSSTGEMRLWLHEVERKLEINEKRIRVEQNLNKLLVDQQALQLEIQREGQILVNRLDKNLREEQELSVDDGHRRRNCVDAIRKKWHTIYLNSLSLVCRIEERLNHQESSDESDSDPDLRAPPQKRARRRSGGQEDQEGSESETETEDQLSVEEYAQDVLPFAESEYESIMDGERRGSSSDEHQLIMTVPNRESSTKWGSIQQDVGYSSGENSIHEAINTSTDRLDVQGNLLATPDMRHHRKRIECSPVKAFYRTVQLDDMSDLEINKAINHDVEEEEPNLSDSMYVNHDDLTFQNITQDLPEYDEVMALMDDMLPTDINMSESFNTKWREIHGSQKRVVRRESTVTKTPSCDASSEDSSENGDGSPDVMSVSFDSSPLKRQRSGRAARLSTGGLPLDAAVDMDGSFCSTRSSATRRKLRVRRMPRSMSDGEQLSLFAAASIGAQMPATSTTRLLRKLDEQLRWDFERREETEQSDAAQAAYEWDEYNPPQKDDSVGEEHDELQQQKQQNKSSVGSTTTIENEMTISMIGGDDDDFSEHFGSNNAVRLIEESKSHLRVVRTAIDDPHCSMQQMSNFELIARSNLRQVEQALKTSQLSFLEVTTLQDLRAEWAEFYASLRSPFDRIMNKVKKFAATLHEVSSMGDAVEIRSKEDVMKAIDAVTVIERRLSSEREELRDLVASPAFRQVADDLTTEFDTVRDGYDEAVARIAKIAGSLSNVKSEWDGWTQRQNDIRTAMVRIEAHLKEGIRDTQAIASEMELCQERMDSLETMCNYLTASLGAIQNEESGDVAAAAAAGKTVLPDFHAELSIYSHALARLKDRFAELTRSPTPPVAMIHPQEPKPTIASLGKSPNHTTTSTTQTSADSIPSAVSDAVSSSRLIKLLFGMAVLAALAAIFYHHVFGRPFGPHLTYVNGPPPT